ncbi:MAG: hypothetical protein HQ538_00625, partial [Parcubacteria group bacterium]|nr:hypothetical protein [Parcubacteria group bacterium]
MISLLQSLWKNGLYVWDYNRLTNFAIKNNKLVILDVMVFESKPGRSMLLFLYTVNKFFVPLRLLFIDPRLSIFFFHAAKRKLSSDKLYELWGNNLKASSFNKNSNFNFKSKSKIFLKESIGNVVFTLVSISTSYILALCIFEGLSELSLLAFNFINL